MIFDNDDEDGPGWCPSITVALDPGDSIYAIVFGYGDNRLVPPYDLVITVQ